MTFDPATIHSLRRVFEQAFAVHDIAEPIVSFDELASADEVRFFMESRHFEIVDASKSLDAVTRDVSNRISEFYHTHFVTPSATHDAKHN